MDSPGTAMDKNPGISLPDTLSSAQKDEHGPDEASGAEMEIWMTQSSSETTHDD